MTKDNDKQMMRVWFDKPLNEIVEAGMCLWEAVLSQKNNATLQDGLDDFIEYQGYSEARFAFGVLSLSCLQGYELARKAGYNDCFDWHFCPFFITDCVHIVSDSTSSDPVIGLVDGWEELCRVFGEKS